MDLAHANLIRSSISALRALKLANPADERVRLETIEKLTRSLDGKLSLAKRAGIKGGFAPPHKGLGFGADGMVEGEGKDHDAQTRRRDTGSPERFTLD